MAGIYSPIEQRNTGKGNPGSVVHFDRPLNNRQQKLMNRLPGFDSRLTVPKGDVNLKDIAALTAETGDEYALFTRRGERLIIRGNACMTNIDVAAARRMAAEGWRWSGHTHPGVDANVTMPSPGDYAILAAFEQSQSVILDSLGRFSTFGGD